MYKFSHFLNTVGMTKPKKANSSPSAPEQRLLNQLRKNPHLMERFQRILDLAESSDGPLKTADEIEDALIEEMRRLGNETMHHWAVQAEDRVTEELKSKESGKVLSRKKKR